MAKKKKTQKKASKKKPAARKKTAKRSVKKKPAKKVVPKKKTVKKGPAKKTKKPTALKPKPAPKVEGTIIGRVEDFFAHVGVIALTLKAPLNTDDTIHVIGHTTDFKEIVSSIQIDHVSVGSAQKGDSVGIKVSGVARKRDWIFRL